MTSRALSDAQLLALRPLETQLRNAVRTGAPERAIEIASQIQALFPMNNRSHHRLLRAKLWAFEACLDANRVVYAEVGFIGVQKLSSPGTRLYLEASSLLVVCYLRQKQTDKAKKLIVEVIRNVNNIQSDTTRRQFQKRLIARIEEECILAELIGAGHEVLNAQDIEAKAIFLLQRSSDDEIFKLVGSSIPMASIALLSDVRAYSLKQLPAPDRLALPSPEKAEEPRQIGKTTFAVLRRVAWKTFCAPNSSIYKLWSKKVPKVFNEGYFSAAVISTLGDFRIGLPILASGLAALIMRYSAEEFCELAKPKGLMIGRDEKDA